MKSRNCDSCAYETASVKHYKCIDCFSEKRGYRNWEQASCENCGHIVKGTCCAKERMACGRWQPPVAFKAKLVRKGNRDAE